MASGLNRGEAQLGGTLENCPQKKLIWAPDLSVDNCNSRVLASAGGSLALQPVGELERRTLADTPPAGQLWQVGDSYGIQYKSLCRLTRATCTSSEKAQSALLANVLISNTLLRHDLQATQHFGANQAGASPFVSVSHMGLHGPSPAKRPGWAVPIQLTALEWECQGPVPSILPVAFLALSHPPPEMRGRQILIFLPKEEP